MPVTEPINGREVAGLYDQPVGGKGGVGGGKKKGDTPPRSKGLIDD